MKTRVTVVAGVGLLALTVIGAAAAGRPGTAPAPDSSAFHACDGLSTAAAAGGANPVCGDNGFQVTVPGSVPEGAGKPEQHPGQGASVRPAEAPGVGTSGRPAELPASAAADAAAPGLAIAQAARDAHAGGQPASPASRSSRSQ
jgi:hypothetical protein